MSPIPKRLYAEQGKDDLNRHGETDNDNTNRKGDNTKESLTPNKLAASNTCILKVVAVVHPPGTPVAIL